MKDVIKTTLGKVFAVAGVACAVGFVIGCMIGYAVGKNAENGKIERNTAIVQSAPISLDENAKIKIEQILIKKQGDNDLEVCEEAEPICESLGEYVLTAYCSCEKCCGKWALNRPKDKNGKDIVYTASGAVAVAGRTVAVDPSVIPYGTKIIIDGNTYVAEDCGGAIKGKRIDVYFDDHDEALEFGKQKKEVKILN